MLIVLGLAAVVMGAGLLAAQDPVVGSNDPESLFTSKDPKLNTNKQAAMHIMRDLLEAGHWDEAPKYLTERYIQHNPGFASGRQTVMDAFSKFAKAKQIPASTKDYTPKIVAVLAQGDLVAVVNVVTRPDPRNPGQTYTTTHYDMWRFVDGKADEHWDEGAINAPGGQGKGCLLYTSDAADERSS